MLLFVVPVVSTLRVPTSEVRFGNRVWGASERLACGGVEASLDHEQEVQGGLRKLLNELCREA